MRAWKIAFTIIFCTCFGVSVLEAEAGPPATPNQKLEARVSELEKRVAELDAKLNAITATAPATTQPTIAAVVNAQGKPATLILDDWDFSSGDGDFGRSFYEITLKLRNAGTKPIKLVDASVQFADLLDSHLYGIKISPDLSLAAGGTHEDKGRYDINQFINEQTRMKGMKKADIKATLTVHRIVFTDNTVVSFDPQ
jgi:hypothetical protein